MPSTDKDNLDQWCQAVIKSAEEHNIHVAIHAFTNRTEYLTAVLPKDDDAYPPLFKLVFLNLLKATESVNDSPNLIDLKRELARKMANDEVFRTIMFVETVRKIESGEINVEEDEKVERLRKLFTEFVEQIIDEANFEAESEHEGSVH